MAGRSYKRYQPGDPLTANGVNENVVRGPMRGYGAPSGASVRQRPDGISVDAPPDTGRGALMIRSAEIQDVGQDYLTVKIYNPVENGTAGASFNVAKPYLLQQNRFDGQTITYIDGSEITYTKDATDPEYKRNHDDGEFSADFFVTPNYYIGEKIFIFNVPVRANGITYNWCELALGRYWATE